MPTGARSDRQPRGGRDASGPPRRRRANGPDASVLALQRAIGNSAVARLLRRPVEDDKGKVTAVEFTVGDEINASLAALAKSLATDGISAKERDSLRDRALKDATITDNERMFLAGLLDPANAKLVAAADMRAGKKVTFSRASIQAHLPEIRELGRKTADASLSEEKQIKALATSDWAKQANTLMAFAKANSVPLKDVVGAMIAAGSDNTAGDMVMAGSIYAVAVSAKHGMAPFLLSGKLKVDQVPGKTTMADGRYALYVALGSGTVKGDTIYVPAGLNISDLDHRATILHELRHAEDDQKAPSAGVIKVDKRNEAEVRGFRAGARYTLDQIAGLTGKPRRDAIELVAKRLDPMKLLALMVESSDKKLIVEIRDKAAKKDDVRMPDERFDQLKDAKKDVIEAELLRVVSAVYDITDAASNMGPMDSFAGESELDWADRPLPP